MHPRGSFHQGPGRLALRIARAVVALQCGVALAGCAIARAEFDALDLPDTPAPEGSEWPRLVDAPSIAGDSGGPDPAEGQRIAQELTIAAAAGTVRAEQLREPVISPAQRARLGR